MAGTFYRVRGGRWVSRRAALRGGLPSAVGLAGAFALACGGDNKKEEAKSTQAPGATAPGVAATTAPEQQPKAGGEYRLGTTSATAGVDPHNSVLGGASIVPIVYNYLVRTSLLAPDKGILPELALSWEQAADKVTTIFKLRPDAMVQENTRGVPVRALDAEDVKLSFERVGDPKAAANGFSWVSRWVDRFEAVDKTTFKVVTKEPYAWTMNNIGNNLYSAVVPREWLASADIKKWAVGSGPYMLQTLEEGAQWSVARNPNFWEKGKPYITTRTMRIFADQATYRTAFSTNQLDAYAAITSAEAKQLIASRKETQFYQDPSLGFESFWMNTRVKPFDDPRVRRAIRRAVNPEEYIQIITTGDGITIGPVTYALKDYTLPVDEVKKLVPTNLQEAKQLLQAAGQSSFTIKPEFAPRNADHLNIFTRQLAAAGITVEGAALDLGAWAASLFQSKPPASFHSNQEYATPDIALAWHVTGGVFGNGKYDTGFSDPQVDADWKKAAGILDEKERIKAYQDLQRLIISKDMADFHFYALRANTVIANDVINAPRGLGSLGNYYAKDVWLNR
ncbi:MAG: ABC transporter substrate-binding protein [Chloroflexi bacterium]|nr:ABC transporter substrate-binding protein [Chloroflexota bacterium]